MSSSLVSSRRPTNPHRSVSRESVGRRNRRQTGATHYPTSCTLVVPQIACLKNGATGVGGRLAKRPDDEREGEAYCILKTEANSRNVWAVTKKKKTEKDRPNKNKTKKYALKTEEIHKTCNVDGSEMLNWVKLSEDIFVKCNRHLRT